MAEEWLGDRAGGVDWLFPGVAKEGDLGSNQWHLQMYEMMSGTHFLDLRGMFTLILSPSLYG